MIDGISNNSGIGRVGGVGGAGGATPGAGAAPSGGASFADLLKGSIDEVARLQQEASRATEQLLTGQTQDITGVFTAMEKSDIAFKTLLAIRGKLMDAYDEIKNMPI
jgi:flagellar hook-basal body complex protein FliE